MHDLIESLALSSKALLRHQEDMLAAVGNTRGRGKRVGEKGRGRTASGGGSTGGGAGVVGSKGGALRKGFSGNDGGRKRRMSRGKSVGIWNLGVIN